MPIDEDVADEIADALDRTLNDMADGQAAQRWSTATDEMTMELGDDVFIIAEFGDWIAVNGDLVYDRRAIPPVPKGFVLTDRGGRVPTDEQELSVESAVRAVARDLKIPVADVEAVAKDKGLRELEYRSVSGDVEIYAREQKRRRR